VPRTLSKLRAIQNIILANNSLTGEFAFDAPQQLASLEVLDVSNNHLSGSLSPSFFLLPELQTFAASGNCFQGNLPNTICQAKQLQSLSLDGLSSACKVNIWSPVFRTAPFYFTATKAQFSMTGAVPNCIFGFANLSTLHLSANGKKRLTSYTHTLIKHETHTQHYIHKYLYTNCTHTLHTCTHAAFIRFCWHLAEQLSSIATGLLGKSQSARRYNSCISSHHEHTHES